MGMQVSMNEEVQDLLLLDREVVSVISSVEAEVSKYEQATNLAMWDSDVTLIWTTFVMWAMIFNSVKDFCYSSSYFYKSLAVFFCSLYRSIFRLSERPQLP